MRLVQVFLGGFVFAIVGTCASAATWDVSPSGCDDSSCAPCCTIQGAVVKSSGGDVISVAPGSYPEVVDFRYMASVGDITVEAASGPGTVSIYSSIDEPLRHGDVYTNTVTLDGLDVTAGGGYSCVYFNHMGNAVLTDVTANDCGYTAIMLDNPGTVVMERCTANSSGRTGIQIDGASSALVTDCTANSNDSVGIDVYSIGTIDIVNPTTVGNFDGIKIYAVAPTTITGATVTDNDGQGIRIESADSLAISGSTITGSVEQGIDINWADSDPVGSVTLTNVDVSNNGHGGNEDGTRLRNVDGPVILTNCVLDDNGADGIFCDSDVVGDIEISGGQANGNGDDGYDLRVVGNATVIGARAIGNGEHGIVASMTGTLLFQNCVTNGNEVGSGLYIEWQDPDPIDGVSVIDCTANNNGLIGGGNGIIVKFVEGPVAVIGTTTNGNSRTGVRVDDAGGTVLIRGAESNFGLEEGFKIDADVGPVTVLDSVAEGNATEGLVVRRENVDVESLYVRRNAFVSNIGTGVALSGLGGSGLMSVQCNDIADNTFGMYLDSSVTVDARKVWWGSTTGPSDQGPGTGDGIFAEPGGTITYDPWLPESVLSPTTTCEFFSSGFESGLLEEWDVVVK